MARIRIVGLSLFLAFTIACGSDDKPKEKENNANNTTNNVNNTNNLVDGGGDDMGGDMMDATCSDGVQNQDESDIDCGGSCDACPNDAMCGTGEDCESTFCGDDGFCATALLRLGEECADETECASGQCEPFGEESYCTESCTETCDGQGLACFRELCTPNTYCDDPDGDGFGEGPGCEGSPCDRCDADATCNEQDDGSFECVCNSGWEGDGETCADIDECDLETDDCDANAECTNTPGSFTCACSTGYVGDGTSCMDINECTDGSNDCDANASCTNEVGSFTCECDAGFNGDGTECTDIDECDLGTDDCDPVAGCINEPGGFSCGDCPSGYDDTNSDGTQCDDIDECDLEIDDCDPLVSCTNSVGSFSCGACPDGYTDVNSDGTQCDDINECENGTAMCDTNATCTNSAGSFACECNQGWTGDGHSCSDIDECANDTDNCDPQGGVCFNFDGGFSCSCGPGYTGDGVNCTDVNECELETDTCADPGGVCSNNPPGSFSCTCDVGFRGDGFTCNDIDECFEDLDNCDPNATCSNEVGSFDCSCDTGFVGDGETCTRAGDTCDFAFTIPTTLPYTVSGDTTPFGNNYQYSTDACPGTRNGEGEASPDVVYTFTPATTGNYAFRLQSDFDAAIYVTTDCTDIDNHCEYAAEEDSGDGALEEFLSLQMTAGTTYFVVVDGGLVSGDQGSFTLDVQTDECANETDTCSTNATCENAFPGFTCTCADGFELDSNNDCIDINECTDGTASCGPNATCNNLSGSFECDCDAGYVGDGQSCWLDNAFGENCTNPFVIGAVPFNASGDTADANNDYSYSASGCPGVSWSGGGDAPDEAYSFTPTTTGEYAFTLTGTDYDSLIYLVSDCSDMDNTCLGADDAIDSGATEEIIETLTAGVTYYFIVDGWADGEGAYTLDVVCNNCP